HPALPLARRPDEDHAAGASGPQPGQRGRHHTGPPHEGNLRARRGRLHASTVAIPGWPGGGPGPSEYRPTQDGCDRSGYSGIATASAAAGRERELRVEAPWTGRRTDRRERNPELMSTDPWARTFLSR